MNHEMTPYGISLDVGVSQNKRYNNYLIKNTLVRIVP
jgi:hypothetical protein